jgi:hypothetical protein
VVWSLVHERVRLAEDAATVDDVTLAVRAASSVPLSAGAASGVAVLGTGAGPEESLWAALPHALAATIFTMLSVCVHVHVALPLPL